MNHKLYDSNEKERDMTREEIRKEIVEKVAHLRAAAQNIEIFFEKGDMDDVELMIDYIKSDLEDIEKVVI